MKRLLLVISISVLSFGAVAQQGNSDIGKSYQELMKEAKDRLKADDKGELVKLANLDSYSRQSDSASLRPIREADVMFQVRLWSKINFREKINKSYDSYESSLLKIIYEGVQDYYAICNGCSGDALQILLDSGSFIVPYSPKEDTLASGLYEKSEFHNKVALSQAEYQTRITPTGQGRNPDDVTRQQWRGILQGQGYKNWTSLTLAQQNSIADSAFLADQAAKLSKNLYEPSNTTISLDQILVEEDLVFDKNHSVPMWDIISITVLTPSTEIDQQLFKVKYSELKKYIDKVYHDNQARKGFWFNPANPGSHGLSFSDAIDKRLFNSYIVSMENVENESIQVAISDSEGYNTLLFAEKIRLQLLERVHNLWEY